MGRQESNFQMKSRPKRKATNSHIFRYLQTRNPSRLEENDLKRALEASMISCPEDSTSSDFSFQANTMNSVCNEIRRPSSSASQQNYHRKTSVTANRKKFPIKTARNRYKPVAKKNTYDEADFFHEGIMEYIEYELHMAVIQRQKNESKQC